MGNFDLGNISNLKKFNAEIEKNSNIINKKLNDFPMSRIPSDAVVDAKNAVLNKCNELKDIVTKKKSAVEQLIADKPKIVRLFMDKTGGTEAVYDARKTCDALKKICQDVSGLTNGMFDKYQQVVKAAELIDNASTESTSAPTPAPAEGEAPAATNPNPASATPEGGGTA